MANHIKAKVWRSGSFRQRDTGFVKNTVVARVPKNTKLRISKS